MRRVLKKPSRIFRQLAPQEPGMDTTFEAADIMRGLYGDGIIAWSTSSNPSCRSTRLPAS
jgi:hypothetical protein